MGTSRSIRLGLLMMGGLALLAAMAAGCDLGIYTPPGAGGDAAFSSNPDAGLVKADDGGLVPAPDAGPVARYHPTGYSAPAVHGAELKMQKQDCRTCHGQDLTGATGPSCDSCHKANWRTTCTYCHGGVADMTGAPPRNLDGTTDGTMGRFPPHTKHVNVGISAAIDCMQCHVKATDVLSPGHVFDSTPGRAETDFGGGLAKQGKYDGAGNCSTNYCHGSGRGDDGTVAASAGPRTCTSCHAGMASGAAAWTAMSGTHGLHLGVSGVTCGDCHNGVTPDGASISNPGLHVNGLRDVAFSAAATGFSYAAAAQTCTGSCHGHQHTTTPWVGGGPGGTYHPTGFAAATAHGPEMELQRQDCRSCHGATLAGGTYAGVTTPSCDGCHKAGWRTNCTYCHGGSANATGAPPRDLGAAAAAVSTKFMAHTAHVTQRIAPAQDCTQCHNKPVDVLTTNHAFDSTPAKAEVILTAGLSPTGSYNGSGTCSTMYCHGNGQGANGTITDGAAQLACNGCHASQASGSTGWSLMSGSHRKHNGMSGVTCATCHDSVTTDGTTIANPLLHVNGTKEVVFNFSGMTYTTSTKRCAGPCHGENHNYTW